MSQTNLVTVQFHDDSLIAFEREGQHYVAMKPIIENIGLQWEAQYKRIMRHPVLRTSMSMMDIQAEGDSQRRKHVSLPLSMLNGWLFGVDVNRVKPELRDKLIRYQTECFDVLARHFMPKAADFGYTVQPTDKLSAGQQDTLRSLLESHVKRLPLPAQGKAMMQGWSKLKAHFGVSYRDIPAHQFTEAVSILTRHVVDLTTQQPSIEPRVDINDGARMAAARDVAMEYLEKYRTAILAGKTRIDMEPVAPEAMEGLFAHALMSQRMLSHYDYTTGEMLTRIVPRDAVLVNFNRDNYFDVANHIPMHRIPEMLEQLSKRVGTHLGAFAQRLHHESGMAA